MTKAIRIENADQSNHEVEVQVWQNGVVVEGEKRQDILVRVFPLSFPTAMMTEYVHGSQYLVIKEKSQDESA
jgi:hypothetical protein